LQDTSRFFNEADRILCIHYVALAVSSFTNTFAICHCKCFVPLRHFTFHFSPHKLRMLSLCISRNPVCFLLTQTRAFSLSSYSRWVSCYKPWQCVTMRHCFHSACWRTSLLTDTTKYKLPEILTNSNKLLARKSSNSGLEIREYCRRDPSRWPRGTLYQQTLTLTSSTSGGRLVGRVRSRTQATEFF
jgi:hypothetical protein